MNEEIVEKGFYGEVVPLKDLEIGQLVYIDGPDEAYYLATLIAFSEDNKNALVRLLSEDGEESEEFEVDVEVLKEPMYYELTKDDLEELNQEVEGDDEEEVEEEL